ncbi:MAG: ABC transporter ATP-binding protein [Eggerthellaceae bacterium]|nr:ABC transporter ATP-binding protein [Eggerthellaceae bacterium]
MRVIRYLKGHLGAVMIIFMLLMLQAFCDLSLPRYTADIVDVGIQQAGIQNAVPKQMSRNTYYALRAVLPSEQEQLLVESYDEADDGTFHINDRGKEDQEALDEALGYPLVALWQSQNSDDFDVAYLASAYEQGDISKDLASELAEPALAQLEGANQDIVDQQAAAAVRSEYDACNVDVQGLQLAYLLSVGVRMLAVTLVGALAAAVISFVASRTGAAIGRDLRGRLFRRVVSFSDAEIQSFSAASLITRGTNDIQQIQMVCIIMMRMVLYAPILAIGGIIMIVNTNVSMSWIIVLAVVLVLCLVGMLMVVSMPKFKIMQVLIDRVNLVAREVITGLPVIRAFNRQHHEEERFDVANCNLRNTQLFTNRVMAFMQPGMMLIMNGVSVAIVWVGAGYIDAGAIQTGDMIAFITYAMVIILSFLVLSMVAILLPRAEVAAQRIDEVLACEPSIGDPANPRDDELGNNSGACIAFEDVSFSYPNSSKPALSHVSFTAPSGKTTAIIGATGSGKTTILRLIIRAYDVTQGKVTVDGIDVRDLTLNTLHGVLGYVPQKAFLFSGTIGSNIAYADSNMSEDRIWAAATTAQMDGFISAREEGMDTAVSQGGTDVSGGQRQRLAIARALASDARAFLFDDSFSALDYATDAALRNALNTTLGNRTVIIVAQRISTIRNADTIIVIDDGVIVGQGTHEHLMQSCPAYREIALSQLSERELAGGDVA